MDLHSHEAKSPALLLFAPHFNFFCSKRETCHSVNSCAMQWGHNLSIRVSVFPSPQSLLAELSTAVPEKATLTSVSTSERSSKSAWSWFVVAETKAEVSGSLSTSELCPFTTKPGHFLCSQGHINTGLTSVFWKSQHETGLVSNPLPEHKKLVIFFQKLEKLSNATPGLECVLQQPQKRVSIVSPLWHLGNKLHRMKAWTFLAQQRVHRNSGSAHGFTVSSNENYRSCLDPVCFTILLF